MKSLSLRFDQTFQEVFLGYFVTQNATFWNKINWFQLQSMDEKFEAVTKNLEQNSISFDRKLNDEKNERKTQLTGFLGLLLSIK